MLTIAFALSKDEDGSWVGGSIPVGMSVNMLHNLGLPCKESNHC